MSLKEIEEELDVCRPTVIKALESGELRFYRFARQIRIRYEDLLAFMDGCAKNFNPRLLQRVYTKTDEAGENPPVEEPTANETEESNGDTGE